MNNLENINSLIGRPVVSLATANKLGEIYDLVIDPLNWDMVGFSVRSFGGEYSFVDFQDVHSIGPHALMLGGEDALVRADRSPLATLPRAKQDLIGVKVLNESGHLLGKIARIFVHLTETPEFICEVRWSAFDRLLGRAYYFPASLARAFSQARGSLVVSADTGMMQGSLEAMATRLYGPHEAVPGQPVPVCVTVRSHAN